MFTPAYHLGEGRVLKTRYGYQRPRAAAYHLGEGRVLKTMDEEASDFE